jgi:PAS domain S-box-containing protein
MMRIAVIGGGARCRKLMELIQNHKFQEISPQIVAVADIKEDAPGIVKAKEEGLFFTTDYNDLFKIDDIDLIIELTGDMDIYNDILLKKKRTVRAIAHATVALFWEISRVSNLQQETKQKLQKTQTMYNMVINELIQEDVLVIAPNYQIVDINDTMLKKLGLKREEAIGRHCYQITHHQKMPCSGENHPCPLVQTLESRQPSQSTHVHLNKDGKEIFYSISCYPLIEGDEVIGAMEISRDITKDINLQRVMMQQEKLASIGRLSAGVAHEINNPLTTILTTAMLIQEDIDPDDSMYRELETIANETLRCRKIVTSLLDFARQTKPAKKKNNINDIVIESILLTKKQATFKDVTIEHQLAEDIPVICVDKGQLQQALINLLLNAIEATDSSGKVIATTRLHQDQAAEITISDTGEGISEDKLNNIFDPFFTTKEGGTGLGLAITHGIIEQHGGTIDVQSQPGRGTVFKIRFPIGSGGSDVR